MQEVLNVNVLGGAILGRNYDAEDGCWESEEKAYEMFCKELVDFLQQHEGKLLTVRKAPHMQQPSSVQPRYRMLVRFNISELPPPERDLSDPSLVFI